MPIPTTQRSHTTKPISLSQLISYTTSLDHSVVCANQLLSSIYIVMKRQRENEGIESLDMANSLTMPHTSLYPEVFECKTCNRKFSSYQALGGHKRPKLEGGELKEGAKSLSLELGMGSEPKVHECSICGQEFSLGGHMRRHRTAANKGFSNSSINQVVAKVSVLKRSCSTRVFCLDLNLTPLENDLKLLLFGKMAPKVQLSSF